MAVIRLGLVGFGSRGRSMLDLALTHFTDVKAVAVCDCNPALWSPEAYPETRFFDNFQHMLDSVELDALLVETPALVHAEFCAEALRRNIAVMSDIPLVRNYEEAAMLWEAGRRSNAIFMTGANPNQWGFIEALVDFHRKGLLGEPVYLEAEYIHDCRSLWKSTPWRETLPPIRYCTHSLGPLLRILPEELRLVSCVGSGAKTVGGAGQHDVMTAHFQTARGVTLRFTASFINQCGWSGHSYRVFGTKGYFERYNERGKIPAHTIFASDELYGMHAPVTVPVDQERHDVPEASGAGHGGADYILFRDFFAAVRGDAPHRLISLKEGLRMTLPGIFAAESAEQGGNVLPLSYPWDCDAHSRKDTSDGGNHRISQRES